MYEIFMEELVYKSQISWKWGCREDAILLFTKTFVPFGSLELHNEHLKSVTPIIQNCQRTRLIVGERHVI